jgi:hypothetical protein
MGQAEMLKQSNGMHAQAIIDFSKVYAMVD